MIHFVEKTSSGAYFSDEGMGRKRYYPRVEAEKMLERGEADASCVCPLPEQDWSEGRAPAVHFTNKVGNRFRYRTGLHRDDKPDETPCIDDYACDIGRQHWPDYVVLPDGRQGPKPFRDESERKSYEKLTHQQRKSPDSISRSHEPDLEKRQKKLAHEELTKIVKAKMKEVV